MQNAVDVRISQDELVSLAKTEDACVTLQKTTRVVGLLPSQLCDIKAGIKENLDTILFKYDHESMAIIIGFKKINILSTYGSIFYGYNKIAIRIEAHLYLFKPIVGCKLKGVVCKQSVHHLGCLVYKAFNVSIALSEDGCISGWDFSIGQEIVFTVIKLDLTSGPLPYIKGQLWMSDTGRKETSSIASQMSGECPRKVGEGMSSTKGAGRIEDGDSVSSPFGIMSEANVKQEVESNVYQHKNVARIKVEVEAQNAEEAAVNLVPLKNLQSPLNTQNVSHAD